VYAIAIVICQHVGTLLDEVDVGYASNDQASYEALRGVQWHR